MGIRPSCPLKRGNDDVSADLFSLGFNQKTHRNGSKMHQGRLGLDIRNHFITDRVVKTWIRLPREMVNAPNLSVFERHLDNAPQNML